MLSEASMAGERDPVSGPGRGSGCGGGAAASLHAILASARRRLAEESRRANGGTAAVERYAGRLDALLQQAFMAAGPPPCPMALIATGGYGRRHLCLHSDLDLLVLFDTAVGPGEERFLNAFLNPLWDLGVTIGHQVRELADFTCPELDNPEFLLALVDARQIDGDPEVFARFLDTFHSPPTHAAILEQLAGLTDARHASFSDTIYQLEPDIKESPGGLRDLGAIRTIARLAEPALLTRGPVEAAQLDEAEDFLLKVRSVLHQMGNRNQNRLTHETQETVTDWFGYRGAGSRQRVERLMSDYFRHARAVARSLEWIRRAAPTPVGVNLGEAGGVVGFVDQARASREPESWLGLFQAALDRGCAISEESVATIRQHAVLHAPERFFPTPAEGAAFLDLLRPRPGLYARLSDMHDCGLLGRLLPEFEAIAGRVTRDFYHKYTVDEHTLLAIRSLERLAGAPGDDRYAALLAEVEHPEWLVLALLMHDVGKWRDDDHAVEGARMAAVAAARLSLPAEAAGTVDFLVREHLRMSRVAFRRDTEDPEVVKAFAAVVGLEERLKLLCLMTLADVGAVGHDTLTPWKSDLLWRLYVDTYNHLTREYADELIDERHTAVADLVAGRPDDVTPSEITSFVEGLPRRYLALATADAIYRHVRLSRDIGRDEVHLALERRDALWELTVVTLDKPFLFSRICGVLSSFGLGILRGHAMTNPKALVLDIVQFADRERYLDLNEDGRERLFAVLGDAVSGRVDVSARLARRERSVLRRRGPSDIRPVVRFDNHSSPRYTIVEISASDSLGLLYRVSDRISRHRCDVDLVLIATEGPTAIDVFHITSNGAKLSDAAQLGLSTDLLRALEASDEAD
jgi:[protein-PII] uridylyltransferase